MKSSKFPSGNIRLDFGKEGLRTIRLVKKRRNLSKPLSIEQKRVLQQLNDYFNGSKIDIRVRVDWAGISDTTRRVLEATKKIKYGEIRTYGEIAKRTGMKQGARAVGQALANNPFPIVIPCHRVINQDGRIGGYRWGSKWKEKLLTLEGKKILKGKVIN